MKIKDTAFVKSANKPSDFPNYSFPEFAFFGRSNVGKSSLINMITEKKSLVRVGSKPGVTTMINFFLLNENISIADLPGFGYARIPHSLKQSFLPLIKNYIRIRENLRLAFLLVDIRREPSEFEIEMIIHLTNAEIPIAVTATKCDKLSKNQKKKRAIEISANLEIDIDSIFFTSSKSREGKNEIHTLIEEYQHYQRFHENKADK